MIRVKAWLDATPVSNPTVAIPTVYHFDAYNSVMIMEDCGVDTLSLTDFLTTGKLSNPFVAETVGNALGKFLATMHEWSKGNPDGILDVFDACLQARKLTARWIDESTVTLGRTSTAAPPILAESDLRMISEISDDLQRKIMRDRDIVSNEFIEPYNTYQN
jgi:5-methylthioribose kinase